MDDGSTFADRLRDILPDGNVSAFSRKVGINATTLQGYLDGSLPRIDKVVRIAAATGFSIDWLATGSGPREKVAGRAGDSSLRPSHVEGTQPEQGFAMLHVDPRDFDARGLVVLPKYDVSGAAGAGRLVADRPELQGHVALSEEYLRSIGVPPRHAELVDVSGDSMFPTLKDREIVIIDTSIREVRSDAIYAVLWGGMLLLKRVQIGRDGSVTLSSDNKSAGYRDDRISAAEVPELQIAGRVKGRVGGM